MPQVALVSDKRVIVIAGPPGSGKGKVVEILETKGWRVISLGDVVREEVESRGMELNAKTMGFVAQDLRNEYGPSAIMERILPQVDEYNQSSHVVIDGVRQIEEMERLQSSHPRMLVIAIDADIEIRKTRVIERSRPDNEGFDQREAREWGWGLELVMELADIKIKNNGTSDEFEIAIDRELRNIGIY